MPTAGWNIAAVSGGFAPGSGESAAGGDYMSLISLPTSRFSTGESTFLPVWSESGDIWTNAVGVSP